MNSQYDPNGSHYGDAPKKTYEDFYQILNVGYNATKDEIKKAFRKLAKEKHPDKNIDDPNAKEVFGKINEAHDYLKNPIKRQVLDDKIKRYNALLHQNNQRQKEWKKANAKRRNAFVKLQEAERQNLVKKRRAEMMKSKRIQVKKERRRYTEMMNRERRDKLERLRQKEREREIEKAGVEVKWDEFSDYSEADLSVIFKPYGVVSGVYSKWKGQKRTAVITFENQQSCIQACEDKEITDDFGFEVKFLGNDKQKRTQLNTREWNAIRPEGLSCEQYEQMLLARLLHQAKYPEPLPNGLTDDVDMELDS